MATPDPAQLSEPVDPAAYRDRPRLFSTAFWAVIALAFLCVLAGAAVFKLGPQLFPAKPKPEAASAVAAAPAASASVDARLADIQARLAAQESAPASAQAPAADAQIAALTQRVEKLETDRRRLNDAAAGALAAAALSQASSASRPFAGELAIVEASLPESPDLRALRPLAESGAPTLASLAAEYPDVAARAAVAARARTQGTGIMARIAQAFAAILTIRRVDKLEGQGVDAVLARAGRKVDDGDLAGANAELAALPTAGQQSVADWRARAARRVEIDRRVAAVRAQALAELTRTSRDTGQP